MRGSIDEQMKLATHAAKLLNVSVTLPDAILWVLLDSYEYQERIMSDTALDVLPVGFDLGAIAHEAQMLQLSMGLRRGDFSTIKARPKPLMPYHVDLEGYRSQLRHDPIISGDEFHASFCDAMKDASVAAATSGGKDSPLKGLKVMLADTSHGKSQVMAKLVEEMSHEGVIFVNHYDAPFTEDDVLVSIGHTGGKSGLNNQLVKEVFNVKLIEDVMPFPPARVKKSRGQKHFERRMRGRNRDK